MGKKIIAGFFEELYQYQKAGIPLVASLETMREGREKPGYAAFLENMIQEIYQGSTFSQALSLCCPALDTLSLSLVEVYEEKGVLEEGLFAAGRYLNQLEGEKRKMLEILLYPATVLMVLIFLTGYLLHVFLPDMFRILQESGDVPLPVRLSYLTLVFDTLLFSGIFLVVVMVGVPGVRGKLLAAVTRTKWGKYIRNTYFSLFFSSFLSQLLKAGYSLHTALIKIAELPLFATFSGEIREIIQGIREGKEAPEELRKLPFFTSMDYVMVVTGFHTGTLTECLELVHSRYEKQFLELGQWIPKITEKIVMLFIGLLIGVVALFFYGSMNELTRQFL